MTRGNLTYAPQSKNFSFMGGWDINLDNGSGDRIEDGAAIGDYAFHISSQYNPGNFLPGVLWHQDLFFLNRNIQAFSFLAFFACSINSISDWTFLGLDRLIRLFFFLAPMLALFTGALALRNTALVFVKPHAAGRRVR